MIANVGEAVTLRVVRSDGRDDLFPQCHVYDPAGNLDASINMSAVGTRGLYRSDADFTVDEAGKFDIVIEFYTTTNRLPGELVPNENSSDLLEANLGLAVATSINPAGFP